ncbi:MAG: serine hydrolase [Pseudohongiella nitratireducens]|nr:serine hydrolase domain-containing protein [Pseudohongiella nitratireducens]MDF1622485.1 serine hydrolase [Pseudohongiella nitratireducens]
MNKAVTLGILFLLTTCTNPTPESIQQNLIPAVIIGNQTPTYPIQQRMAKYNTPGVSIAIFNNNQITWTDTIGVSDANQQTPLTTNTKFQAASISKPITALGVLKLTQTHNLDLDTDINQYLTSWQVKNPFDEPVTIRRLLNHTAGVNISGFQGYPKSDTIPDTVRVLNGLGNTPAIEVMITPGTQFNYSGGGYTILQQLIQDITGTSFQNYFQQAIFQPLQMTDSTFNQYPQNNISLAHDNEGQPHPDGWLIYPELAAAGLWTTPTDIAKFAIAIQNAHQGKPDAIIPQHLANAMLTPQNNWGLGVGIRGEGTDQYFFHGGANPGGYKNIMVNTFNANAGIVVMTNAEQGNKLHDELIRAFSAHYNINVLQPRHIQPIPLTDDQLARYTGTYQYREAGDYYLTMTQTEDNQLVLHDPNDGMTNTFLPVDDNTFVEVEEGFEITFDRDAETNAVLSVDYNGAYTFYRVDDLPN